MELNHMKNELRQTAPPQNFGNPSGYTPVDSYRLGKQNTTDVVNESRIDRQLPGFSNNVNVSRMSFDQGFQVTGHGRQPGFDRGRNVGTSQSMPNNSFYQNKNRFGNDSANFDRNLQNSFVPQNLKNEKMKGNYYGGNQGSTQMSQNFGNLRNPSGYSNNSMSMNNPSGFGQNNVRNSPTNGGGRGYPSPQNGGMGHSNQFSPSPTMQRTPAPVSGNPPMEEIEKGQLEQFSKFLISKKEGIESKLNTMPKVCRRVADKREKLQLNKELDEVNNELEYVQGILRGP